MSPLVMIIIGFVSKIASKWIVDWLMNLLEGLLKSSPLMKMDSAKKPTAENIRRALDLAIDETPRRHVRKRAMLRFLHAMADKLAAKSFTKSDVEELAGNLKGLERK